MKKWLSISVLFLLIMGILAACGPDDAEPSNTDGGTNTDAEAEGEMPEKPEALTLWVNAEEKQEEAVKEITDKYTEETGIKVNMVPVDMLEQVEKLDVEGPAGNGPDVIFQPHDRIGDLVLRGLVDPVNLGDKETEYTQTALDAVQYDGEYWGYPAVIETYAMYYNKSLVDEEIETMEDLMAIAERDTNASNDEFGFLMEAANFYFVYPFFSGNGAYVFANDAGNYDIADIGLANEGSIEGGNLVQSWFDNGYIPQDLTPDIMNGLFQEGKVSSVINGPWMVRDYSEALGDDLAAAPLPILDNGENPKSFVGVKSYMLSYYSENKEWAEDLMAYITNFDNSMTYYDVAGEIPARDDAMEDSIIADDPIFSAFAEQTTYGEPMPSVPAMQQVWDPINNALSFISKGEPVDEVLEEAVQTIQDQIAASGAN
ncbi:extracellular solute-binding protein [Oceanobacillus profundus]|uniref:sugar ABC transporter substrate-binding protein n=1 Tax=Oceanobacillus TaxID=182709 RepID=UPI000BA71AEF|nr:extracellular solute-binding protein [Oceanobacillus profundus]MBR3117906.1 extracellular solute-binding protein [Oceanobacillus sp.]MCM3397357.1 extracellular solute-binding protein [Oceanobacillus profundus]MDO6451516.1 extracellular solute-binding protein [Oceanobacillus profundus]PAE28903.1 ABC transporter substrate-binding protein [Paenibacillus sp. 7884-2]